MISNSERYYSLDTLRGIMMLLGIVLHGGVNYIVLPTESWPFKDGNTSSLLTFVVYYIHVFRMPAFFVISGFFAAMLIEKKGGSMMLKNRFIRIFIPAVAGYAILYPLVKSGFIFAISGGGNKGAEAVSAYFNSWELYEKFSDVSMMHLWFLWYLVIYYIVFVLLKILFNKLPITMSVGLGKQIRGLFSIKTSILLMSVITALTLFPLESNQGIHVDTHIFPKKEVLMAHGVFFFFGVIVFYCNGAINTFSRLCLTNLCLGTLACLVYFMILINVQTIEGGFRIFCLLFRAFAMWTLIFGTIGVFIKYYDKPSVVGKYLSQASYWIYLVHLPLVIWFAGMLTSFDIYAVTKFIIVCMATTFVSLFTYHFAVRYTFISWVLNGKIHKKPKLVRA